jgi:DNA (cytosine-5)-methyltransferase 1
MTFDFVEVCSGCGGLSTGFMNKGFTPLLLNEIDKNACKTLKHNHKNVNIVEGDFNKIDFAQYKNVDLLMGGVPCQSFSQAGKRLGFEDIRGNLLLQFIEIIHKTNPKVFLIENVKGLSTHDKGETLNHILEKLKETKKYNVKYQVVNSNDYDVAQKRERLIIIGVRKNIKKQFEFPEKQKYKPILSDVLTNVPKSDGMSYSDEKKKIMDMVPQDGCWVNLPLEIQKSYMKKSFFSGGGKRGIAKRLSMNKPSLTLTTSPCQKQTERCHPLETRPLNVREYARIQSFPDSYKFLGSINQQYKQIGNAVPVKLAEHLAESIKKILE